MGVRHVVRRGDTLWGLAGIYLGSGTKFPEIQSHHNSRVLQSGPNSRLLPIKDANWIYIGQTICIPSRTKNPGPGAGRQTDGSAPATGVQLKMQYSFEEGVNPITYPPLATPDFTVETEMTGRITIENLSHNGYRHNFELAMTAGGPGLAGKTQFGDKAVAELTKSVELQYAPTSNEVILKPSIATYADIGPYRFEVSPDAPNHLTHTLKPPPINAVVEKEKRRYTFTAEIAFKVEVTWHPVQSQNLIEYDADRNPIPGNNSESDVKRNSDSMSTIELIGLLLASILIYTCGPKALPKIYNHPLPASSLPFIYYIDPNNPGGRA